MAEGQVTVDGHTHPLQPALHRHRHPEPPRARGHLSPARQPARPVPHAHLDGLPRPRGRDRHPRRPTARRDGLEKLAAVVSTGRVVAMANAVRGVHVAPAIKEYLVDVADATRRHPYVWVGMSPRATLALQRVARARAAAAGRTYVSPDDLKALALPVLAHRLQLTPDAAAAGHLGRAHPAGHPRPGAGAGPGRPVRSLRRRGDGGDPQRLARPAPARSAWCSWAGSPAASSCSCWGRARPAPGGGRAAHGPGPARPPGQPPRRAAEGARRLAGQSRAAVAQRRRPRHARAAPARRGDRHPGRHRAGQPAAVGRRPGGPPTCCPPAGGGCCRSGRSTSSSATPSG